MSSVGTKKFTGDEDIKSRNLHITSDRYFSDIHPSVSYSRMISRDGVLKCNAILLGLEERRFGPS